MLDTGEEAGEPDLRRRRLGTEPGGPPEEDPEGAREHESEKAEDEVEHRREGTEGPS